MAKRPASQYYWGDWHKDLALQSCSLLARGLWHEMNCLMHQGEPYGHLTMPNGKPMSAAQLANLAKISERECKKLLAELEDAAVFSRDEAGTIYSRRMVRDEALREARAEGGKGGAEHGAKGGEHGKKGGRPTKDKGGLKTPLEDVDKGGLKTGIEPPPSSSSSSSSSTSVIQNQVPAVVGVITPNREKPPTTTATTPLQRPIDDWKPRPETVEALSNPALHGVPEKFIREQVLEFRTYWRDRNLPATSWDSKFIQRCASQWKTFGHEWRENPEKPHANNQRSAGKPDLDFDSTDWGDDLGAAFDHGR